MNQQRGLCVEPRNADLKKNLKEIDELIRGEKVSQFISQAEAQLKAGDYGAAMRAVDAGMRLDAGNSDLKAVLDRAKPKFEAAERSRRSGLSSTELLKEKGDDFYKKASFEVKLHSIKCHSGEAGGGVEHGRVLLAPLGR